MAPAACGAGTGPLPECLPLLCVCRRHSHTTASSVPVLLQVSLDSLKLQPNGAAKTLVLALQKAHSSKAMLNLNLQWLKSTKQAPTQQQQQQSSRVQRGMKAPVQLPTQPEQQQLPTLTTRSWDSSRAELMLPGAPSRLPEAQRTVSALVPSNKSVSWHDKVWLHDLESALCNEPSRTLLM